MVETGVHWVDGVEGVLVNCFEPLVVKVQLEIYFLIVLDNELQLLSSLLLLLIIFPSAFLQGLLLLFEGSRLFFLFFFDVFTFAFIIIFCLKSSFKGNLKIILLVPVLLIVAFAPVTDYFLIFDILMDDPLHAILLLCVLLVYIHAPVHLIEFFLTQSAPVLLLKRSSKGKFRVFPAEADLAVS